jgi:DNA-binding sugar fermentation-stimulating protein
LFIQDTKTLIEIKTVISLKQEAVFSSIYSERAGQQLERLADLLSCGYKVVYLIVALNPTTSTVLVDKNSAIYPQLQKCLALGMQIYGISLHTRNQRIEVFRTIAIEI